MRAAGVRRDRRQRRPQARRAVHRPAGESGWGGSGAIYAVEDLARDAGLLEAFRASVQEGAPPAGIRCAKIKVTPRCNLRCAFCSYWRIGDQSELPTERWLSVLRELAGFGCAKVHFSGGEPLLRSDIHELLAASSGLGMRTNMTTNGTLIRSREDALALVATGCHSVSISVESPLPKLHDRACGVAGAHKRTGRAVEWLVRARAKLRARTSLRLNTVLTRWNYTLLPEVVRLAGELGCDDVVPMPVDERGPRSARLSKGQIEEYNAFVAPQVLDLRGRYGYPRPDHVVYPFGRTAEDAKLAAAGRYALRFFKRNLCYAPWLHLFLAWDGAAYLCCMSRGRTPPLGSVASSSVSDVFLGAGYEAMRGRFRSSRLKICRQCDNFLSENAYLREVLCAASSPSNETTSCAPFAYDGSPRATCQLRSASAMSDSSSPGS
jgi:MoaA/NifB/PqqE/SkfB family radical SAM enzyme